MNNDQKFIVGLLDSICNILMHNFEREDIVKEELIQILHDTEEYLYAQNVPVTEATEIFYEWFFDRPMRR